MANGLIEIYGESVAKPVFSAEFDMPPARAAALAFSELRLAGEEPRSLTNTLPVPRNVAAADTMAYATALASLAWWNAKYANLLPAERRTVHSRARFIPTAILAVFLLATGIAWLVYIGWRDQRYLDELHAEIAKVQPAADRADALDRLTADHRAALPCSTNTAIAPRPISRFSPSLAASSRPPSGPPTLISRPRPSPSPAKPIRPRRS